ncbi:hypothetical protein ACRAWF_38355 [Streptomyces sp. L7]
MRCFVLRTSGPRERRHHGHRHEDWSPGRAREKRALGVTDRPLPSARIRTPSRTPRPADGRDAGIGRGLVVVALDVQISSPQRPRGAEERQTAVARASLRGCAGAWREALQRCAPPAAVVLQLKVEVFSPSLDPYVSRRPAPKASGGPWRCGIEQRDEGG